MDSDTLTSCELKVSFTAIAGGSAAAASFWACSVATSWATAEWLEPKQRVVGTKHCAVDMHV